MVENSFKRKAELKHGIYSIVLSGSINETADFGSIPVDELNQVFIDFSTVKYINSSGIKKWIVWLTELQNKKKKSFEMYFSNCPKPIVDQMNLVKGFMPVGTIVKSFYVPYFCEICNVSESYLFKLNSEYTRNASGAGYTFKMPKVLCPTCKQTMEDDFFPEKYFSFLKNLK